MKVLYSSKEIRSELQRLLGNPDPGDRRVAPVAYIGSLAETYLPSPKGLHVICSPTPGATSPRALRSLIERGSRIEFSPRLHMKVHWSRGRGCIIASANASAHALGAAGLKEAGVVMPPGVVDSDRLIEYAEPHAATVTTLKRLQRETKALPRWLRLTPDRPSASANHTVDYVRWFHSDARRSDPWKLGWWEDPNLSAAKSARVVSEREYGISEPAALLNVARDAVAPQDWLLCFQIARDRTRAFDWMCVNFVVPVRRGEQSYEPAWPFQAVQVHKLSLYNRPPFELTPGFRRAFDAAAREYGLDNIRKGRSLLPPPTLVRRIAALMRPDVES